MREISSSVLISYHNRSKSTGPCKSNVYICTYEPPVERKKKKLNERTRHLFVYLLSRFSFFMVSWTLNLKTTTTTKKESFWLEEQRTHVAVR